MYDEFNDRVQFHAFIYKGVKVARLHGSVCNRSHTDLKIFKQVNGNVLNAFNVTCT